MTNKETIESQLNRLYQIDSDKLSVNDLRSILRNISEIVAEQNQALSKRVSELETNMYYPDSGHLPHILKRLEALESANQPTIDLVALFENCHCTKEKILPTCDVHGLPENSSKLAMDMAARAKAKETMPKCKCETVGVEGFTMNYPINCPVHNPTNLDAAFVTCAMKRKMNK